MSDDTNQPSPFTEDEMNAAASGEQAAMNEAQMAHLNQRVVSLRANLDRALTENAALLGQLNSIKKPTDRKRPAIKRPPTGPRAEQK